MATIDLRTGIATTRGDPRHQFLLASISKVLTAWAILVAVEEGSIDLATPVGQPGCTLRHLLSHAGGYPFAGTDPVAAPGQRRIYSNSGIELAAGAVAAATDLEFGTYLDEAVLQPLAMNATQLHGSPAHMIWGSLEDLITMVHEIAHPTLLSAETVADATSVQFPSLAGLVPGVGSFRPCPWGLGFEIHGEKARHWMGATNSPATVGHFGGSGTMMWIDPAAEVGLIALTDRDFDQWSDDALRLWPQLSDAALASYAAGRRS